MNEKIAGQVIAGQVQDMLAAAQAGRIPENIQAFAEDTVQKTREAFDKVQMAARDGAKALEDVVLSAQAGAKAIGDKLIHNTNLNAEAAFRAAEAMARAKTLPEFARLQAEFMQAQLVAAGNQSKELLELSSKVTRETFETMNAAAVKSFEQTRSAR